MINSYEYIFLKILFLLVVMYCKTDLLSSYKC